MRDFRRRRRRRQSGTISDRMMSVHGYRYNRSLDFRRRFVYIDRQSTTRPCTSGIPGSGISGSGANVRITIGGFRFRFSTFGEMVLADTRPGRLIDAQIDDKHKNERDVESTEGGEHRIPPILADNALVRFCVIAYLDFWTFPSEQGWHGYDGRDDPAQSDHDDDPFRGSVVDVVDPIDRPVPVKGYGDQVQDRRGTTKNIKEGPDVADDRTKKPPGVDLVDGRQGHDQGSHHQIRHRQGRYQVVGHVLQVLFNHYGRYDEDVTDDRHQDDDAQNRWRHHKMRKTVWCHCDVSQLFIYTMMLFSMHCLQAPDFTSENNINTHKLYNNITNSLSISILFSFTNPFFKFFHIPCSLVAIKLSFVTHHSIVYLNY